MMRSKASHNEILNNPIAFYHRQKGGLTIFTGIFVLILMTLMLLYATRVGIFEQRVSSNEVRQKVAFHAAESVVDQGAEYLLANSGRVFSSSTQAVQIDETTFRVGWFANDGVTPGWVQCTDAMIWELLNVTPRSNHPCGASDINFQATTSTFFYDDPTTTAGAVTGADSLPIDITGLPADSTARLTALLCLVEIGNPTNPCRGVPGDETEEDESLSVMQLMGYGYSDCTDITDLATCTGEARIARPMSNYKNLAGSPRVPLTSRGNFPPTGSAEVVANPDGGGLGVPISTWINGNPECSTETDITSSGSWQTCELQEWYSTDTYPEDVSCPTGNCSCGPGGNDTDYFLSWRSGGDTHIGIDIVTDPTFPCDLFETFFGVPREMYQIVKDTAKVIGDCNSLDEYSTGFYWVSGPECKINAGTQVGSASNPILLVSAASSTSLRGGAEIFGTLYIFDGEDPNAELSNSGTNTVYGAVIVDAVIGSYQGTFQVVYAEGVISAAGGFGGLGSVSSGWRDFGLPAWQ